MSVGLLVPFQRDKKRDFAHGGGAALLVAKAKQVLATSGATPYSAGELPWRTEFGCGLDALRHAHQRAVLLELARVHVEDALTRWLPEVTVCGVDVEASGPRLTVTVHIQDAEGLSVSIPVLEERRNAL